MLIVVVVSALGLRGGVVGRVLRGRSLSLEAGRYIGNERRLTIIITPIILQYYIILLRFIRIVTSG